jgi:hypothetical protein
MSRKPFLRRNVLAPTQGMGRPPLSVDVTSKDQKELTNVLSGGVQQVRVVLRVLALLQLAKGASPPQISNVVSLTPQALRKIGHRYREGGLEAALHEKQRPGASPVLDAGQRQRIIAMVYSDPPEGRARWTCVWWPGSGQTATGSTRGKGNHPDSAPGPRSQSVARKNVVGGRT